MSKEVVRAMGWIKHSDAIKSKDIPLTQEYLDGVWRFDHPEIQKRVKTVEKEALPSSFSLLSHCSPVRDQKDFGLCFAFAGCGIMEYYDTVSPTIQTYRDFSEMFLGYYARYVMNGDVPPTGDDGCTILDTMKAMVRFGICLEAEWMYTADNFNKQPIKAAQDEAIGFAVSKYFLIPEDSNKLTAMKQSLVGGVPLMYGSDVHQSIFNVGKDGKEPYASPTNRSDPIAGGHARYIIGYDDSMVIPNTTTKGAFLVRNSWGGEWGQNGNSWVSYKVFLDQETDCMGITSAVAPTPNPTPAPTPEPTPTPNPEPTPAPTPTPSPVDCSKYTKAFKDITVVLDNSFLTNQSKMSKIRSIIRKVS